MDLSYKNDQSAERNSSTSKNYSNGVMIRSSVMLIGLILVMSFNNFYQGRIPLSSDQCANDLGHNWTDKINKYFIQNIPARNTLLIASALFVDLIMLTTYFYWIFKWTDWVVAYAIILFYGVRGFIVMNIFQITFPEGYNFFYPGFPSIAVCYLKTNDFFYSGHIGFPIIFFLEYWRKGIKYLAIPCLFISLFEGFMMLITRGHYTIDLIFGVIFAHYLYKISLMIAPWLDNNVCYIFRMCTCLDTPEKPEAKHEIKLEIAK